MKKIILSFLMIVCCLFCFAGCNEPLSEKYWEDTSASLTQYFESDEYKSVLKTDNYGGNLDDIMSNKEYGGLYAELTEVYAPLFEQTIICAMRYANVFALDPSSNTNNSKINFAKLKSNFAKINKNLSTFKSQVKIFLERKDNYIKNIDFKNEATATSEIEKARLNNFKFHYLNLLEEAYNLSALIFDTYTEGYYDFLDLTTINKDELEPVEIDIIVKYAVNGSNLELANSAIKVLKLYLNKGVENDYDSFLTSSQSFYTDVVKKAYDENLDLGALDSTAIYEKLLTWEGVYSEFVEDSKVFNKIVQEIKIDILKKYNDDTFAYANETQKPSDQAKANFFLNYDKNVKLLHAYAKSLLSMPTTPEQ